MKLLEDDRGVSEVLGYVLILALIVLAVSMLYVTGNPIIQKLQGNIYQQSVEQGFTVLDSQISAATLGEAPVQTTTLFTKTGSIHISNTSRITITRVTQNNTEVVLYNHTLGTIEWDSGNDVTVAYEGGGVWRKEIIGTPVMISPPEFHYNGETLTFPIIELDGTGSAGGGSTTRITAQRRGHNVIYPNTDVNTTFVNPVFGQVRIVIKSKYYEGWAKYVEERTAAQAVTHDGTQETVITLNANPTNKSHVLNPPIDFFGIDTTNRTPLREFNFNLSEVDSNFHLIFRAPTSESEDFVIEMQKRTGCGTSGMSVTVYYNKGGANETWDSDTLCWIIDNNASIDMLNSSANMTYTSNSDSVTWNNETPPYNQTYTKNDDCCVPLDVVLQHYIRIVDSDGTFSLHTGTKSGDPAFPEKCCNITNSTFILDYGVQPPKLTYLHIVNHTAHITIG
jgi:hypothetical protein